MIMNVDDPQVLSIANAADFGMLHGRAIAPAGPEPKRMSRLPADAVLPQLHSAGSEEWF